jgi:hypothetical protein
MSNKQNVFTGKNSIEKILNPDKHPMLPMVELPTCLNPFADMGVHIFAKLITFSPLGNIKALPSFNIKWRKQ